MNELIKFNEFPKIARLSRNMVVTEKLDGTNASILITENGDFLTASRNRWITPQDDNYGFSRWAHDHKEELLKLGVGHHFGEWWGQGIQRKYGMNEKRWSLFNVSRWCEYGQTPKIASSEFAEEVKYQEVLPSCVYLVPELYRGKFCTLKIEVILQELATLGSVAAPTFAKPEGIVVYHEASRQLFKKTIEKDDAPKGKSR